LKNARYPRVPKIEDLPLMIFHSPTTECWIWIRTVPTAGGYCQVKPGEKVIYAHRWVYECLVGPVPEHHDLHHTCHNPKCVNPAHLVPVHEKKHKMKFHSRRSRNEAT